MLKRTGFMFITVLLLFSSVLYAKNDFEAKVFKGNKKATLNYRIHEPTKLDKKKYPLFLVLHGAGHRGNDNNKQIQKTIGPHEILTYAKNQKTEVIIIAPQVPQGEFWVNVPWWELSHDMPQMPSSSMQMTIDLLNQCIKKMPVDTNRIYVTGLSMGGFGTWDILQRMPNLFSAAIPICGGGDAKLAGKIRNIPIWAFHGDKDKVVKASRSRDMIEAIKKAGGKPLYTEYKGIAHNSWKQTYADQEVLEWLFKQRKSEQKNAPDKK
jgi:predicted peptidase